MGAKISDTRLVCTSSHSAEVMGSNLTCFFGEDSVCIYAPCNWLVENSRCTLPLAQSQLGLSHKKVVCLMLTYYENAMWSTNSSYVHGHI